MPMWSLGGYSHQDLKQIYKPYSKEIRVKIASSGQIFVTYINHGITYPQLQETMLKICGFYQACQFTLKYVDDEGDPCTISSQMELDEVIRLHRIRRSAELSLYVLPGVPAAPGLLCQGEHSTIYRQEALRWKKMYKVNGHIFKKKKFNQQGLCAVCHDRVWALGRQNFECIQCHILVHKKCHKSSKIPCSMDKTNEQQMAAAESMEFEETVISNDIEETFGRDEHLVSLADFNILSMIGAGSFAKVFLVEQRKDKKLYAMKVMKKEVVAEDEDIDWVYTEKHVLETASNYPFLVGLYASFQDPSRLFFVIEFVSGGDLLFHLQNRRRLLLREAIFYSAEICLALHFLHTRGIIYRDLKLDNVLLDREGHIKLTDYGMCKQGLRPGDTTSTFCGTPNYIAPEIISGMSYTYSVDWWSLGVLIYEMLMGRNPFSAPDTTEDPEKDSVDYIYQKILNEPVRIPRSLNGRAISVLRRFLNKNPLERLGSNAYYANNGNPAEGASDPEIEFNEIREHIFFRTIDWNLLEAKQVNPPYRPALNGERDLANFSEFTSEPVQFTPDDEYMDQLDFEDFEYVNPLMMTAQNSA